jgi:predicted extracellular nuclease
MKRPLFAVILVLALLAGRSAGAAPVSAPDVAFVLTGPSAYTQDFDTVAYTPDAGTSSTLPTGWALYETGTAANTTYGIGTGSSTAGNTYSLGATGATERAFGGLRSGSLIPTIGANFGNDTGGTITSLVISYNCEQWRIGVLNRGAADRMDFQYSLDATSLSTGTWVDVDALDCYSTVTSGAAGALMGNTNRTAVSGSVTSLSIAGGAAFWIRWTDYDISSSDDGLGVDDFSLTPTIVDDAPTVSSTTPANGATSVVLNADIIITFSEAVNVATGWYTISCGTSGAHTAVVTGGPTTFTLNPDADFVYDESCTVTVLKDNVNDQDGNDPPNYMSADYVFTFTAVGMVDTAPFVSTTTPTDGASNVAINGNVDIRFSEAVNVASGWYTISCGTSGSHTATVSGGPTIFSLDPDADLSYSETCTVTIVAANVTDQDTHDPPDYMTGDDSWSFTTAADPCAQSFTHAYEIQGSGATPAITGVVTTQGVVVGDYELPTGSGQLRGFYIQDLTGDGNAATSDGLFIYDAGTDNVSVGQVVRVTGTASDYQDQTQVSSSAIVQCGTTGSVTPVDMALPVVSATALEPFEGMLVRFPQTLYVTEHYQLGRFGQVVMSSGGRLRQPTNIVAPGVPALTMQAANDLNRIIVDDDTNVENPDPIKFGRGGNPLSATNTLRGSDTATGLVGVLSYTWSGNAASGNAYRLRPIGALNGAVTFQAANARPGAPSLSSRLRVSAGNLLNYFNTFGTGACTNGTGGAATDCRGADSQIEFDRQWPKTVANLVGGGADVIGFIEMENDGYGASSAIQDLVTKLNNATASGTYAFINADTLTGQTNALGTDAIKVGLIYKPAKVTPVGTTAALNSVAFVNGGDSVQRNRPALAQAFEEITTGERFIVVVNHLKSKGSACDAPDASDGQGNCNAVRTNAANTLTAWLANDNPTDTGDPDILIMGDLNAYAKEDPITAIQTAGYVNLPESLIGANAYSYAFDGQWGYLDHALGTSSLTAQVAGIVEWHINADEPSTLDYNTDYKSAGQISSLYASDQFRASDHDPVVVGLNLAGNNDLSDLPASYGAAWHTFSELQLGNTWAAGHAPVGSGSNDGIVRTPGVAWSTGDGGSVEVTVTGTGYVTGWIDWNQDGDFGDSGEQVFTNEDFTTQQARTIPFPIPTGTTFDTTFSARFRVYRTEQTSLAAAIAPDALDAAPSPIGGATGGEVEDYTWVFGPNAVMLSSLAATAVPLVGWPAAVGLGALGIVLLARRWHK